jgi:hypothetical protein
VADPRRLTVQPVGATNVFPSAVVSGVSAARGAPTLVRERESVCQVTLRSNVAATEAPASSVTRTVTLMEPALLGVPFI